jgi:cyclopropane-fatty-acyl-phospholipid synthase
VEGTVGVADQLAGLARRLLGSELPVGLRAWDGSRAGPDGVPTVVLNSPRALRRQLWNPGELGLAQAYVTSELDVQGDLAEGLRLIWADARRRAGSDSGSDPESGRSGQCRSGRRAPGQGRSGRRAPGQGRSGQGSGSPLSARTLGALPHDALNIAVRLGALGLPPAPPDSQARLRGRLHTGRRDRAAIAHHYDLSNDFYALVLDESMAYSCAYWTSDAGTSNAGTSNAGTSNAEGYGLAEAQRDKLDLVCRKLGLRPGMRLLDVGCGWGSLSLHAAAEYGAQVTGITLSRQQAEFARARARALDLAGSVRILLQDYRELSGTPFDAVASIEMGEHVGQRNYPRYAATLHRMVAPGGRVLVQQMSRRGGTAPGGGAFIEAFIAPDMHMRPVGETVGFLERSGLEVRDVHGLREHYVRTVAAWYETFERRLDDVVALVGEEVARVWRLYLVGGALAFEEGRMGVDQILAVRPGPGGDSGMPAVRIG